MRKYAGFLGLIIAVLVVSYFNRWIFVYKFEPEYWENYYYNSQWNVPNSKRIIPDEGVYRYIGYRLVNGENPFNVDYWVPPMGKYWYGVGAKYLGNPYLISFGFYLISTLVVLSLTKNWLIVYLWALNPLIVEQIGQTMLDLPMTVFFLSHILLLFKYEKSKSIIHLGISGIFLGLMAGTKPAYFVPMIGLVDWWWIFSSSKKNKIKYLFYFLFSTIVGYVLAYTCYFIVHPNPIPWIRLHEKVINFQKGNGGSHDVLNIFKTIFLDKYKGFWVGGKEMTVKAWSTVLPIGTILMGYYLFKAKQLFKENGQVLYLSIIGVGYVLMCLTVDFWPRYLVLLMPILTLTVGYFFNKKPWIILIILLSYAPWLGFNFFPNYTDLVNQWEYLANNQQYRETYRLLDNDSRTRINENEWLDKQAIYINANKETIKENNEWKFKIK